VFHDWNDGGEREHSFTVAADMPVYSANFIRYAQLTIGANGSGSITAEPASPDGYYPEGSVVELRATPEDGYQFGGWTGFIFTSHGLSQNPLRIAMRAPSLRYTANFTNVPLTVVTSEPTGLRVVVDGTTITTPRNYVWLPESRHEIKVEAGTQDGGFDTYRNVFRGWSDEGEISHTVTAARESRVLTARFQTQYLIARGSTNGGTLEFNPAFTDGYYDQGTALQLVPTATGTNRFVSWSGDATGFDAPGQLLVDDHKLVGATFQTPRAITSVANAATRINLGAISAGGMVIISGLEIGPENGDFSSVRVTFDQANANVVRASRNEITVVVPESVAGKTQAVMTVSVDGIPARTVQVAVLSAIPGIFTVDESGKGQAKAWNEDGSENNSRNPAPKGSVILVTATSVKNGSEPLSARVAGRDAAVESVSTDDSGVAQVKIRLPKECPSGPVPVVIRTGDASSLGTASIAVRQP